MKRLGMPQTSLKEPTRRKMMQKICELLSPPPTTASHPAARASEESLVRPLPRTRHQSAALTHTSFASQASVGEVEDVTFGMKVRSSAWVG